MTSKTFERLPKDVIPEHYKVEYKTVDLVQCTFEGQCAVEIYVTQERNSITLHALELELKKAEFRAGDSLVVASKIASNADDETICISFETPVQVGKGHLILDFSGILNDKMKGFYRSKQSNGLYAACTHFEPTGARMAFPCWDEPALKATFDISLRVPNNKVALSNMNVLEETIDEKGFKLLHFTTTPRMSTYLIAFVIGDFDFVEDKLPVSGQDHNEINVRVYTPVGKKKQGEYSLQVAKNCLIFYNDYFGIPYPIKKCDLIAISDFPIGAMENWGLVTFSERRILCHPENTSSYTRQMIALVIAHELAHMWFGNLVTMDWWTDLWLKEGFAEFIMYLSIGKLYPELQTWSTFMNYILRPALELDALDNSHPIEIEVGHPSEVNEIFDKITYNKGASIIRMLESFIGNEHFKKGLRQYLNEYKYGNATTNNLWTSLETVSSQKVGEIMSSWTQQKGFPLVQVVQRRETESNRIILDLKQKKFSASGQLTNEDSNQVWAIPITLCTSREPNSVRTTYLFDTESSQIVVDDVKPDECVKLNVNSVGFYHVLYESSHLQELLPLVESKLLSPLDRFGLQNDLFALVMAGKALTVDALKLMKSFVNENDLSVWAGINAALDTLHILLSHTDYEEMFCVFGRKLFQNVYADVGWDMDPKEPQRRTLLRSLVIRRLGLFGDESVVKEAERRFEAHINGSKLLSRDLRPAVYRTVINSSDKYFESLLKIFRSTQLHEEKNFTAYALGCTRNPAMFETVLKFAMSSEVRSQDAPTILSALTNTKKGRDAVWSHFTANCNEFQKRYKGNLIMGRLVKLITENFATESKAVEIEEFFKVNPIPGTERNLKQSLEIIRIQAKWLERDLESTRKYLSSDL